MRSTRAAARPPGSATWARNCSGRRSSSSARRSSSSGSCRRSWRSRSCGARATPSRGRLGPGGGSDHGGPWMVTSGLITGQKVWTSLAHVADWCFVLARTPAGLAAQRGPVLPARPDAAGRRLRSARSGSSPARPSSTRCFSTAPAPQAGLVVGEPGDGWRIARATLGFERGVATLGQQIGFRRELASWRGRRSDRRGGRPAAA